jgi:hypothetical protein
MQPFVSIERERLAEAQKQCVDAGAIYTVQEAWLAGKPEQAVKQLMVKLKQEKPLLFQYRATADATMGAARSYEMHDHLLYKKIYDSVAHEVQLRCVVPDVPLYSLATPFRTKEPVSMRKDLYRWYHESILGGHTGRERTVVAIQRDWWWSGMYSDIKKWCKGCLQCLQENGTVGISAWTRTNLYSRPFRVLQFDLLKVPTGADGETKFLLTCICCFSRWCWLIPLPNDEANSVAKALLEDIMAPMHVYPHVLRSDNDRDFIGSVVQYMNKVLEIRHITGSTYHPQSQGCVERMHRTFGAVMRGLIDKYPDDWERCLPFAVGKLRGTEMGVLGGRSPFEVVTGMKPTMPATLKARLPVGDVGVDEYVKGLIECLDVTHKAVQEAQKESFEKQQRSVKGRESAQLKIGDVVLLRNRDSEMPKGENRWTQKTSGILYRITEALGANTFKLGELNTGRKPMSSFGGVALVNKFGAERLVKVDMPELDVKLEGTHRIELFDADAGDWRAAELLQIGADGKIRLRYDDDAATTEWLDLSKERYRWIRGTTRALTDGSSRSIEDRVE